MADRNSFLILKFFAYKCKYERIWFNVFSLYYSPFKLFQVHPIQCRATGIRFRIRYGQDIPAANCGFIGKAVFRQRSSHTERYLLRRHFRKPLLLVVGQSDGFCPKCAKLRCIGNYIIKTENQVALRTFREDRYLNLNALFFKTFNVVGNLVRRFARFVAIGVYIICDSAQVADIL